MTWPTGQVDRVEDGPDHSIHEMPEKIVQKMCLAEDEVGAFETFFVAFESQAYGQAPG